MQSMSKAHERQIMTKEEAIDLAVGAFRSTGVTMGPKPVVAIRVDRHMRLGKNRHGWLVVVPLNVPDSFEPNSIDIEVYEPDGQIHIPDVL
jgi:hypothetical protein